MLKIYHLAAKAGVGYDSYDSFVVIADNETEARALCAEVAADEGEHTWQRPMHSSCAYIGEATADSEAGKVLLEHIVVASFTAG
tara:strand:+ start:151 stop:402 length:252 start_codon:yes stop_codon:yes gene_type:complete